MTSYRDGDASLRIRVRFAYFSWLCFAFVSLRSRRMSDEDTSSASSDLSGDEELISSILSVIKPYQFEPEFSSSDDEQAEHQPELEEDEESRTTNLDW